MKAAVQADHPLNEDCNCASQMGVSYTDLTTKDGKRHSTAVAFLRPALDHPNLGLISNARVHKVEIEDGRATGVSYMQDGRLHAAQVEQPAGQQKRPSSGRRFMPTARSR